VHGFWDGRKLARDALATLALATSGALAQSAQFNSGITSGTLQNAAITEASGIVASRMNYNVLWTHNDSGHPAQIFPITPAGANLGTYSISGASSVDWEDIATGPGPTTGAQYIYAGDIGDNLAIRSTIAVYRIPEPPVIANQPPANVNLTGAAKLTFAYPDGARDAESLLVDPLTRDIYIITKREATNKRVYRAAYPQATIGTTTLQYITEFPSAYWLTGADISPDGNEIIVRGGETASARMFFRPPGGTVADAFASTPITIPLQSEAQGEAIGFDSQGWGYYTTSEGAGAPIDYFDRLPPHAVWITTTGSFGTASNWDIGAVPNGNYSAHFGSTASGSGPTYAVNFAGNVSSSVVIVHRDNVTWSLNGMTYAQSGFPGVDSFVVGSSIGESATLTISNGTASTAGGSGAESAIGRGVGAVGVVNLGSGAKWINSTSLFVGKFGSGVLNVNSGATATLSNVYLGGSATAAGGSGALNVTGGVASISGALKAWNNGTVLWSGGSLSASSLVLTGGGKAFLSAGGSKVLRVTDVSVDSANGSKLDLADDDMIVDYSISSPLATIQSLIQSGYNGGAWTGNGITSSSAAAASSSMHKTALGYADAAALYTSFPAAFSGQSIDNTAVLIRYTLSGDANLDGAVDTLDFNALAANFSKPVSMWSSGNFNYDAAVDSTDFNLLASNFGQSLAAPAFPVIVPEPGIAISSMTLAFPMARRLRRQR
jgi:T5SS/PEP-CTERM-associated repeat protein